MGWNHRLLAHKEGEGIYLQIHEVYYDTKGVPNGYTDKGVTVGADDIEGIDWVLGKMKECLSKPILSVEDFPKEYKLIK